MITSKSVSIVIPVFNEEQILKDVVEKLVSDLKKIINDLEILLIENGSTDKSLLIAKQLANKYSVIKVKHLPKANYGLALKTGFKLAKSDLIINFSVDWVDIAFLKKAINYSKDYDIVLASKLNIKSKDLRPILRRISGLIFHQLTRLILGLPFSDTHGIRLVRRNPVLKIINECLLGEEGFESEMLFKSHKANLEILELPVVIRESRPSRSKITKIALRALYQLFKIKYATVL